MGEKTDPHALPCGLIFILLHWPPCEASLPSSIRSFRNDFSHRRTAMKPAQTAAGQTCIA
jgi:hypothetical protein